MKNILMNIFVLLIAVLLIMIMVKGVSIGNFKILSVSEIIESSKNIDKQIENVNYLKNSSYKDQMDNLQDSVKKLAINKQNYLDIASVSTETEIKQANVEQVYSMEFLWNKVGSYATNQGVNLKWEVKSSGSNNKKNLYFTVVGSYIGITNYIYALENDSDLLFKIENFKLTSGSSEEQLSCTFYVSNIAIKTEETNQTVNTNTSSDTTTTSNNTSTTNTTNSGYTIPTAQSTTDAQVENILQEYQ
jgi:uncharacterized protein (DUF2164 family)